MGCLLLVLLSFRRLFPAAGAFEGNRDFGASETVDGVSGSNTYAIELGRDRDGTKGACEGLLVDVRMAEHPCREELAVG
jgi:hypothetical protein